MNFDVIAKKAQENDARIAGESASGLTGAMSGAWNKGAFKNSGEQFVQETVATPLRNTLQGTESLLHLPDFLRPSKGLQLMDVMSEEESRPIEIGLDPSMSKAGTENSFSSLPLEIGTYWAGGPVVSGLAKTGKTLSGIPKAFGATGTNTERIVEELGGGFIRNKALNTLGRDKVNAIEKNGPGLSRVATGNILSTNAGLNDSTTYIDKEGKTTVRKTTFAEQLIAQGVNAVFDIIPETGRGVWNKVRGNETRNKAQIGQDIAEEVDFKGYNVYFNLNKPEIVTEVNKVLNEKLPEDLSKYVDPDDGYINIQEVKKDFPKLDIDDLMDTIEEVGVGAIKDGDKRMFYSNEYGRIIGKVDENGNFKVNTKKSDMSTDIFADEINVDNFVYDVNTKGVSNVDTPDMPTIIEPVLMYGKKNPKKDFKDMSLTNVLNAFNNKGTDLTSKYNNNSKSAIIKKASELDAEIQTVLKAVQTVGKEDGTVTLDSYKGKDVVQEPTAASTVLLNSEAVLEAGNIGDKFSAVLKFFNGIKNALVVNGTFSPKKGTTAGIVADNYKKKIEASRGAKVEGDGSKPSFTDTEKILFNDNGTLKENVVEAVKAALADVVSRKAISPNSVDLGSISSATAKKAMDILGIAPKAGKGSSDTMLQIESVLHSVVDGAVKENDVSGIIKKYQKRQEVGRNFVQDGIGVSEKIVRWAALENEVSLLGKDLGLNKSTLATENLVTLEEINTRDKAILNKYSDVMGEFYNKPTMNAVLANTGDYKPVVKNKAGYEYDAPDMVDLGRVMSEQEYKMDLDADFGGITLEEEMSRIMDMSDSDIALLIGKEDLYNSPLREMVESDINEQRAVAETIHTMIVTAKQQGKSSVYYPSTILENLRVMQDDPASPQSKNLALYAIRPAHAFDQVFTLKNYEDGATAIDTILDMKINMFGKGTNNLHSIYVKHNDPSLDVATNMNEFVKQAKIMNGGELSIKQALFLRDAYKYLDNYTMMRNGVIKEFSMPVIGEIDAKASVFANIAAILGVTADDLRVGIAANAEDFRTSIAKVIKGFDGGSWDDLFSKQEVKDFLTASKAYRGSPDNMINVMAEHLLTRMVAKISGDKLVFNDKSNPFNKKIEALIFKNLTTQNKQSIMDSLNKYQKLIESRNKVDADIKSSTGGDTGTNLDKKKNISDEIRTIEETLESMGVSIDQSRMDSLSAVDVANLYELKRKLGNISDTSNPINENEIAAFGKFFRLNYGDKIKTIMDKAIYDKYTVNGKSGESISGAFTKYTDMIEEVSMFGQASFFDEFMEKKFDTPDRIAAAFKDFGRSYRKSDGTSLTDEEITSVINKYTKPSASIEDIVNGFFDAGFNNDSIYNWNQLDSIIPKIPNPMGNLVRVIQLSGSARYDRIGDKAFHKRGLTVKTITTPFYMQSIDSAIMHIAYQDGVNKFDANVNTLGRLIEFGKRSNGAIQRVNNSTNGFEILSDTMETTLFKKYGIHNENIPDHVIRRLATENLVQNGMEPNGKLLDDKITEYRTRLGDYSKTVKTLEEYATITNDAKTRLRGNRNVINNYALEGTSRSNETIPDIY